MRAFARGFEAPDKTTTFPNGSEDLVAVEGSGVARLTFLPGWRWSSDVSPMMGMATCPVHHVGYCLQGSLHVEMDDGVTLDIGPGDLYAIPPGHDAWVLGTQACIMLDWVGKARALEPVADPGGGPR